ncbi:MAG: hypothetical protein HOW73_20280 [Polyangiaceae bacterium]|nr:hypothetical protein [Polyangiaceae bacterium]
MFRPSTYQRIAVAEQYDATERALLEGATLAEAAFVATGSAANDERPTLLPPCEVSQ